MPNLSNEELKILLPPVISPPTKVEVAVNHLKEISDELDKKFPRCSPDTILNNSVKIMRYIKAKLP